MKFTASLFAFAAAAASAVNGAAVTVIVPSTTLAAATATVTIAASSLVASAAPAAGGSQSQSTFTGEGTYYSPGLGACGETNTAQDLIAAINKDQYGNSDNPNDAAVCGKCALVKNQDGTKSVKVRITDRCPVCKQGDLDLSPAAFQQLDSLSAGRIPIQWSFVDC
ncbi:hypothetical protein EV182_000022 [Spiromyces aspiralis]|uniref:Uncharacterized protein n=1 Tax=Spiromyces aspiralis TaxID=68401 RepID=A0ACC1HQ00_9FUNG|nr:hypothetical protein EV182_000022 [Spiromyces aspiralis]